MDPLKYVVIFIVGAVGDILFNMYTDSLTNASGPLLGLQKFYDTISWYSAAFWAGVIFVIIYLISDLIYEAVSKSFLFSNRYGRMGSSI